ncbi:MAG: hypothetical protein BJ554DRAFT_6410 [Olpidium bornovanus]|uniref:Phosphodiesterase n=1 Tax=Olpidium bornovanus TaxID=278681 RepID=A0A8H8DK87_9FUNG|nr:MAG: hypothetical protein BJ554DRAFT_6410 [Olpidium bornovanus]
MAELDETCACSVFLFDGAKSTDAGALPAGDGGDIRSLVRSIYPQGMACLTDVITTPCVRCESQSRSLVSPQNSLCACPVTVCDDRALFRAQLKAALNAATASPTPAPLLLLIDVDELTDDNGIGLWSLKQIIDDELGGSAGLESTSCTVVGGPARVSESLPRPTLRRSPRRTSPLTVSCAASYFGGQLAAISAGCRHRARFAKASYGIRHKDVVAGQCAPHVARRQRRLQGEKARRAALGLTKHKSRTKVQRIADRVAKLELATRDVTTAFLEDPRGMSAANRKRTQEENLELRHLLEVWESEDQVREQKLNLRRRLQSWNFDPRKLESEQEVLRCVALLLEEAAHWCGGLAAVGVDKRTLHRGWLKTGKRNAPSSTLHRFIVVVRSSYNEANPYHNFHHAVDVLQATYFFLRRMKVLLDKDPDKPFFAQDGFCVDPALIFARTFFRPHEVFALLVAALCHDLGHPGVNNMYMTTQRTALAELYNDTAVLENYHSASLFALLRREKICFFGGCGSEPASVNYREFRQVVTSSILATDMGQHTDYVKKVQGRQHRFRNPLVESSSPTSAIPISQTDKLESPSWSPQAAKLPELRSEDRILLASILVKCADISNPARPFSIARDWCMALMEEFEIQRHIECGLVGDEDEVTPAGSAKLTMEHINGQIFFIDKFVVPLWDAVVGDENVDKDKPRNCDVMLNDEDLSGMSTLWGGLEELRYCRDMVNRNRREWVGLQRALDSPREPRQPGNDVRAAASVEEGGAPDHNSQQRPCAVGPCPKQSPPASERAAPPAPPPADCPNGPAAAEPTRRASPPSVGQVGGKSGRGRVKIVTSFSGQQSPEPAFDSRVRTAAYHASNTGIQRFEAPITHL